MKEVEFIALINRHQAILHKICALYRDSKEDREDLFQEIVFQLWKSIEKFEGRSEFSTWMYRIALSTAMAVFRKKNAPIFYTDELPEMQERVEELSDQQEQFLFALKKLNDADKAFVTLYLEELSYKEIAAIIGITENNVGVKMNRIKTKLQQILNTTP
jgi:RNA polymerase sigma-70 factor (ECF subfamily)